MPQNWHIATLQKSEQISEHMRSLVFSFETPQQFVSGQHYDIRLTAPDGYQAERSYSIANAPGGEGLIELGVELLPDGEVSPYLWSMKEGTQIEMRGPIGGHFVWNTDMTGPLILLGGGSGLVPLMSMLRDHVQQMDADKDRKVICFVSSRSFTRIPYWDELQEMQKKDPNIKLIFTVTDTVSEGWKGYTKRFDQEIISKELSQVPLADAHVFICGSNPFVAGVSQALLSLNLKSEQIKTERFGG